MHLKQEELNRYRHLYEELPAVCLILDQDLVIRDINRYGCEQLGYQQGELHGKTLSSLSLPEDRDFLEQKLHDCLSRSGGTWRWECLRKRKDGCRFWVRDTVRVVDSDWGRHILISSEDITETRYLINELEQQSAVDSLTGLLTRRKFDRYLEEILLSLQSERDTHGLFYIDLDQFKLVNDTCGHLCGDELLRQVGQLLRKQIRSKDILSRLGGDEFGLILVSCSQNEALQIGEKILHAFSQFHFSWEDQIFTLGASIGGVIIDGPYYNSETLMKQADTACYIAKEKGRNRIQMYDSNDISVEVRGGLQRWVNQLNNAFETGRFTLYQQQIRPLSPAAESTCRHCEILLRLRDDGGQMILPGAFIPAAEYYNLSPRIDRWVTREVVALHARSDHKHPVIYFINLSGLTLGDDTFIQEISSLLEDVISYKFRICFEITETAAIRNLTAAISFMDKFRDLGCEFALDDFGSGFSSFGYLKTLPVDFIKIDGSFVTNIIEEPADLAVVRAINEVAGVFGKRTIAECVESGAVQNVLKGLGIDYVQGYHIGRPKRLTESVG
jgi:diguanylate cyclase (GGDEF)-like protein/PAS domain S-box-containing protein